MHAFTPLSSLFGGALIGLAAAVLMALTGRVAGVSGITAGLLSWSRPDSESAWRLAFIAGLVFAPLAVTAAQGVSATISFVVPLPLMIVAGLLVGFGTVLGNGCTSGHGVCGIARLSGRSLVATATFMATGMITVFVMRHVVTGG
jgi:uncharacterized membrane protein YedE/YeeE